MEARQKIVVTGATGMIASRLIPMLIEQGHEVTGLVRDIQAARKQPALKKTLLFQGNVAHPESIEGLTRGADTVIHLAVLGHLNEGSCDTSAFTRVNVGGTAAVIEESLRRGVKRIIYLSSSASVGRASEKIIDESTPLRPETPYGCSKRDADELVAEFIVKRQAPVITLRFTHVYGPGDRRDFLKICKWIKWSIFPQLGLKPNFYPALYIDDAAWAISLALKNGRLGQTYLVTDDDPHDTRRIRRLVQEALGFPPLPYPVLPHRPTLLGIQLAELLARKAKLTLPISSRNIRNLGVGRRFTIEKAKRELGFRPKVTLENGIFKTVEWYLEQGLL